MCIRVGLGVGERSLALPTGLRERLRVRSRVFATGLRDLSRRFGGGERDRERVRVRSLVLGGGERDRERLRSLGLRAGLRERSRRFGGGLRERSRRFGGGLRERECEPLLRVEDDDDEDDELLELEELDRDPEPELLRDELLSEELVINE